MTVIAKPVIADQFWILTNDGQKVGNVTANNSGYSVKLGDSITQYTDLKEIANTGNIQFQVTGTIRRGPQSIDTQYPIEGQPHNVMYDIKRKLQLYTKSSSSKCYHVCGWFTIYMNGRWTTTLCPKYIYVQRYPYHGPYKLQEDAVTAAQNNK